MKGSWHEITTVMGDLRFISVKDERGGGANCSATGRNKEALFDARGVEMSL